MARKIIAVTGATSSGKSQYITSWYGERPERRRIARTLDDIKRAVASDCAAIIEVEPEISTASLEKLAAIADQLGVPLKIVSL